MPKVRLTERFVRDARCEGARAVSYWDTQTAGLSLRVEASGRRSYRLRYTSPILGTRVELKLGEPPKPLPDVRAEAAELKARALRGTCPKTEREQAKRSARGRETTAAAFEEWLALRAPELKDGGSRYRWQFKKYVKPSLGRVPVADLNVRDVYRLRSAVLRGASDERSKEVTWNRVRALLSAFLRGCEAIGLRPRGSNPCAAVPRFAESSRAHFLPEPQVRELLAALRVHAPADTLLVCELILATGCRLGEIVGLTAGQIDRKRSLIELPSPKQGKPHTVPLSPRMLERLEPYLADRLPKAPLFTVTANTHRDRLYRACEAAKLPKTKPHDLRRSAASLWAARGFNDAEIGRALGHGEGSAHTKVYVRRLREAVEEQHRQMQASVEDVLR